MPDLPSWFPRIPELIAEIQPLPSLLLDRFTIERLFGVSRRQAIRILHSLGGYQVGRTYVVEKDVLLQHLQHLQQTGTVDRSVRRRQRVWQLLRAQQQHWAARHVEVQPPSLPPGSSLAFGVTIEQHCLTVAFQNPADLLQKLYSVVTMLADDYAGFEQRWFQRLDDSNRRAN
jgi:hypothetical protein